MVVDCYYIIWSLPHNIILQIWIWSLMNIILEVGCIFPMLYFSCHSVQYETMIKLPLTRITPGPQELRLVHTQPVCVWVIWTGSKAVFPWFDWQVCWAVAKRWGFFFVFVMSAARQNGSRTNSYWMKALCRVSRSFSTYNTEEKQVLELSVHVPL